MTVNYKIIKKNAVCPFYSTVQSAGADLYACIDNDIIILSGETKMIGTGICIEIPEGYAGFIYARSGLASKKGLAPANKVGVIDSDYRGEIIVALHNHSVEERVISNGDRIAQIVFTKVEQAVFILQDEINDTERGTGGFGSTGSN